MRVTKIVLGIALVLALMLGTTLAASAQSGTWVSGIMIQNQSATDPANVTVMFYWAEGTANAGDLAFQFTDVIPAGEAKTYYIPSNPLTAGLPADFVGSAVVSSDQPVVATVNTQLPTGAGGTVDSPNRVGTASGVLDPSLTLYFTQVMKAYYGWNSYLAVQNTTASEASVTIRYYSDADGNEVAAASETVAISPYSSYIFRQEDNANLAVGFAGSAVVTGDQLLAGIANFYNSGETEANASFLSYNASGAGAATIYIPRLVKDFYGYQGGLKIQNVGTEATDVTINYFFGTETYTQTETIQPNAATSIYMGDPRQFTESLVDVSGTGSAILMSSGADIIATVNEDNRTMGRGTTYNGIAGGTETSMILFPQVTSRYFSYSGGVQVQNVGTEAAVVTFVFSMSGHEDETATYTVEPNSSVSLFAPNEVSYAGFNGSVTATSAQPIVGIANFSVRTDTVAGDNWPANYGDSYVTYNGFNR